MRAPGGLGLSSLVAARLAALAVGRSLTLVTVVAMERLTALQAPVAVVPPAVARLKVVVGVVLVARGALASARRTRRLPGVPWKLAAGTKRTRLAALKTRAPAVERPAVGRLIQSPGTAGLGVAEVEICQTPWAAV